MVQYCKKTVCSTLILEPNETKYLEDLRYAHKVARTFLFNTGLSIPQIVLVFVKVRLFLDRSCAILSSSKIVVIFNNTSADFVLISADVLVKMTTILKRPEDWATAI